MVAGWADGVVHRYRLDTGGNHWDPLGGVCDGWVTGTSLVCVAANLDDFRDAIASLHVNGSHVGYLATTVEPMRAGLLLRRQERVWLLLTLLDDTVDMQEDYAPWAYVSEIRQGHIEWASSNRADVVDYEVRWLSGDERERAWVRYGVVEDVGTYIGRAARQRQVGRDTSRRRQ